MVDPDPEIYVRAGSEIFGPFVSGTMIKYTEANGGKATIKPGSGEVDWRIKSADDLVLFAVDASGNESDDITCLVPDPPK